MSYFEYRTVPAPVSVPKVKGLKTPEARFGHALAETLNREGQAGWEFQSVETMTISIKRGLFSKRDIETLSVLVFRRWVETEPQTDWRETASTPEHLAAEMGGQDTSDADPEMSQRTIAAPRAARAEGERDGVREGMPRIEGATRR